LVKLPSPVKVPLDIDVSWFEYRCLFMTFESCTRTFCAKVQVTNSVVKLPSPVNAPSAIDVIRLEYNSLEMKLNKHSQTVCYESK
jgi:hypothetical protein